MSTLMKQFQLQVVKLEADLKKETQMKELHYKAKLDAEAEIEQVHALLDVLPGAAGRKTEHEDSWSRKDITAMTRLASYLVVRGSHA